VHNKNTIFYIKEGVNLFYVSPEVKPKFDSLSQELKDVISEKDVQINSLNDLIKVLEEISEQ
jgi:hypothetical protein